MERANDNADATEGPGNVSVDEPTQPALEPDDDDFQNGQDGEKGETP